MDLGASCVFQALDTADMVMMVMRDQDVVQLPAAVGSQPIQYGLRVARVDHCAAFARSIL
ncbi:hypothetical protein D3C86_1671630 [compost metagenome]